MDFTTKQWLIGIIVAIIIVILVDGFRRMRKARRDSLYMSLDPKNTPSIKDTSVYGSEFPNGGARASEKSIDPERIHQVKSQYDFGRDLNISSKTTQATSAQVTSADDSEDYSNDQWVDAEEGDEEYYASQWDDEELDEKQVELEPLSDKTVVEDTDSDDIEIEENTLEVDDDKDKEFSTIDAVQEKFDTQQSQAKKEKQASKKEDALPEYQTPKQASLNLEESVPMLMDSLDDESLELNDEELKSQAAVSSDKTAKGKKASEAKNKKQGAKANSEAPDSATSKSIDTTDIRTVGKHIEPTIGDDALDIETHSANKPRFESKYFANKPSEDKGKSTPATHSVDLQEVLVVNVKAHKGTEFHGDDILQQVLESGMRYGSMNIFHRHQQDDGEGPVLFSMANMLKPGIFDLKSINELSTAGVTFFITLPVHDNNNMAAFELMINTAKNIAKALGGDLNDENRSIMTAQTIEHYRERIRDFSRKQQLAKNK